MKHLVIAEKPSVGRDIARVLHCNKKTNTYIEGTDYIVTWALGHLVTLADPEQYGEQYKTWNMDTLPMLPEHWKLVVIKQTCRQFHAVKELIFRKDVSDIIIATDAGREGELVARWILNKAGNQKPLKRLWISSVTDKAIREGFQNLRPGKSYEPLYRAAVARAQSDWVVGINATRALTCKYNAQLSCGRVQTPTLAMIAAREEEIRTFKPVPYYGLKATVGGITFTWTDARSGSSRSFDKDRIQAIKQAAAPSLLVTDVRKKLKKTFAPALYDLTALQREANQKFGFSAKQTLNIMQRLYENHKVLTYPRTDSRYLTTDIVPTLKERLKACAVGPYSKIAGRLSMQHLTANKSFVNDSKVSDHHAIIPTEQFVQLDHMSNEERKIYDLVVRRFLAVLSPACEYEETSISGTIGEELFSAKGNFIRSAGWREVYESGYTDGEDEEEPTAFSQISLPDLKKGETLPVTTLTITEGKTKPPAYFTEGTLIAAMENPVKYLRYKDKDVVKTLGETGGLGTVATRADIIEKLFNSFLMEKKENEIHITSKGKQLLSLVPSDLKSPELTASWEMRLQAIAKGKESDKAFMKEIEHYTKALIQEIKSADGTFRHDNMTRTKCPECGKFMLEVNGKHGKMLVCQDRECGHKETISRHTNARCPVCHKKMDLVGKGDGQRFICVCGHKEKLSSFEERKKKEGKGASKKDVNNYLRKQAKEAKEPINTAFAEAFSKIQL
ncbi:DNA topoisomerase III [Mediterraneibacter gnavus]|uniref:DNA topoisomerase III n=1 Tax=Mediterraneibacter gnavus TaxID=33038 RepID=UPI00232D635F|nr:DNA topoisomerase III [Mediterraneibacter gnavus]MDB8711406.1 DNA topoisomerase III [Mediterraneibacter gnavus]MDB8714570.1 DNA topoisomerase III [Mediterraneibacter gnavus]